MFVSHCLCGILMNPGAFRMRAFACQLQGISDNTAKALSDDPTSFELPACLCSRYEGIVLRFDAGFIHSLLEAGGSPTPRAQMGGV